MILKDSRTKRQLILGWLGSIGVAIVIALVLSLVFVRLDEPGDWVVGAGIETVSTTFLWTTTTMLVGTFQTIAFVAGIWLLATSRTYIGAGVTRREIVANHMKIGAVGVGVLIAVVALFWGLSFLGEGPVLDGVSAVTVALIPLTIISMYVWGSMLAALFLRFRMMPVIFGLGIALMVIIAADILGSAANESASFFIDISPAPILGDIAGGYLSAAGLILAGGAVTYAAITTLPMRRS